MKIDFLQLLHNRNIAKLGAKNLNCALIGESGSGKSWAAIRLAEQYYKIHLNKRFTEKNIVFTISEFLERVGDFGKDEKCSILVFDDCGLKYSSSRWFDDLNQILGYTLQSYRYRIINVFFTIPVLKWLDRIGRGMLHGKIELKSIGNGAYYRIRYNQFNDKVYSRRTCLLQFKQPGAALVSRYEEKKHNFLDNEYKDYLSQARERERTGIKDLKINEIVAHVRANIKEYQINGKLSCALLIARLDLSHHKARHVANIINNDIIL